MKVKVAGLKIGIVISTNDPETVWNAFRFGNVALKASHTVKVFLVNKGVEAEDIKSEKFNVKEQVDDFIGDKRRTSGLRNLHEGKTKRKQQLLSNCDNEGFTRDS